MGVDAPESGVDALDISESVRFSLFARGVCKGNGRDCGKTVVTGRGAVFHEPSR